MLSFGDTIAGRYRLEALLGRGGMGSVYLAAQLGLGRTVALKVLESVAQLPLARFTREAQALARLTHPNVVRIHDFGLEAGLAFIAMEYVEGVTLEALVAPPRPLERCVEVVAQTLDALHAAHQVNIVHRDVKPANVLLRGGPEGEAVVVDFGVARLEGPPEAALTGANAAIGTPAYMSPEQVRGEPCDARADVYGAACVLYQLLTGRPPFAMQSVADVLAAHLYRLPEKPSALAPSRGVPFALEAAVLRALAKQPSDRFTSAAAFAAALRESLAATPPRGPQARPTGTDSLELPSPGAAATVALVCTPSGEIAAGVMQNALAVAGFVQGVPEEASVVLVICEGVAEALQLARSVLKAAPAAHLILCTDDSQLSTATDAIRLGAFALLPMPLEPARAVALVQAALAR